jgi:hypothetical protein
MSLEQIDKLPDANLKAVAREAYHQRQRAERLEKARLAEHADGRRKRVEAVIPKVSKAFGEKLRKEYERVNAAAGFGLSLADDGTVTDSFEPLLALAEEYPDVPALLSAQQGGVVVDPYEEPHPREMTTPPGELTPERAEEVVNEQLASSGLRGLTRAKKK